MKDKNSTQHPSTADYAVVDSLEKELFVVSRERDSVDQDLRKAESVKVRSLSDKVRKDTLQRRLVDLTNQIGAVRKKLRECSALER